MSKHKYRVILHDEHSTITKVSVHKVPETENEEHYDDFSNGKRRLVEYLERRIALIEGALTRARQSNKTNVEREDG